MARGDGDWVVRCEQGHLHWGRHGAAGLLIHHEGHVLLQKRAWWTPGGNTWALFGGARDSHEDAVAAALRETSEESTLTTELVTVHGVFTDDHGGWSYQTVIGSVEAREQVHPGSTETAAAAWVAVDEVERHKLFAPFAKSWPVLRTMLRPPVLVVDGANVVGSRPDGWWRDRAGAARRLRDGLDALDGLAMHPYTRVSPEVVLVVEGAARGIGDGQTVRVVDAPGSGDDTIAGLAAPGVTVVTADRGLRDRCEQAGASVAGPRWLLDSISR